MRLDRYNEHHVREWGVPVSVKVVLVGVGGYGRAYLKWLPDLERSGKAHIEAVVDPLAELSPRWKELAAAERRKADDDG